MPRLSADQWETIRAEREAGASFGDLATKFGIDKAGIVRRAKTEGWGDGSDVEDAVRRKVTEKVTGLSPAADPKRKAAAIDDRAERIAEVLRRHCEEPKALRERLYAGLTAHRLAGDLEDKRLAFEDLKAAKISTEAMMNIHKIERQAWGIESAQQPTQPAGSGVVVYLPSNGR